jgi:Rieske Fe-S protein
VEGIVRPESPEDRRRDVVVHPRECRLSLLSSAGPDGAQRRVVAAGAQARGGKNPESRRKKVAAYRDDDGRVSLCSPVCTHLQCIVAWNNAERTWDCPCHGSRFKPTGEVISGPAESPLEKIPSAAG